MVINYTTGYAGTGKSTALLELIKTLDVNKSVILCPTHKAIRRLMSSTDSKIEIKTLHALLGWIPSINEDAEHVNHIDVTVKLDREIEDYTDIVIDEGGMMSEDMLMEITSKLEDRFNFETDHITIHIFLDPYQLLPVKGKQIMTDPDTTTHLTTQHRAESPDVVALFTKFVNYLEGTNKKDLKVEPSENVVFTNDLSQFNKGDRLLCYTNEAVGKYNEEIAKSLGVTDLVGQAMQLGSNIDYTYPDSLLNQVDYDMALENYESDSLYLQNNQINKKYLEQNLKALVDCEYIDWITTNGFLIPVVIGTGRAYEIRNKVKKEALKDKSKFKWVYALNRAFTLDYTFASTVHKAQGSEFDRVWIDKKDIQKSIYNGYYGTYARLMYVAISRSKKKIFIIGD